MTLDELKAIVEATKYVEVLRTDGLGNLIGGIHGNDENAVELTVVNGRMIRITWLSLLDEIESGSRLNAAPSGKAAFILAEQDLDGYFVPVEAHQALYTSYFAALTNAERLSKRAGKLIAVFDSIPDRDETPNDVFVSGVRYELADPDDTDDAE